MDTHTAPHASTLPPRRRLAFRSRDAPAGSRSRCSPLGPDLHERFHNVQVLAEHVASLYVTVTILGSAPLAALPGASRPLAALRARDERRVGAASPSSPS